MSETQELDATLERALSGDRDAVVALLEALAPRVRGRLAAKITGGYQSMIDVDDVMQITYLEAFLKLKRFTKGDSSAFLAWLTRLAENNLIDAIRAIDAAKRPGPKNRIEVGRGREDSMAALVDLLGITNTTPSVVGMKGEAGDLLEQSINALPADYAKVVRMYDLAGKSAAEVARELGRSEGAVFMLRARAHDRLKELLGPSARFFSTGGS
ncbi:MAG: RNA polymerase sigma factor [Phycisphaerales bacterium]